MATNSLTSTASGDAVLLKEGIVQVSGTFVGTWKVEIDAAGTGTWTPVVDPSTGNDYSFTAPGAIALNNGVPTMTRITCSAYTSGTLVATLA